ncbi:MAG: hypothetical protein H6757_04525 [Candidatus Omnitrophica bacterium]|nr:hypothetical protein [Candidatus Omnitrophota bacterium]
MFYCLVFLGLIFLNGCVTPAAVQERILQPANANQNQLIATSQASSSVFEKVQSGIRVSTLLRRNSKGLLTLWIRVSNENTYPVDIGPEQIFLTAYSQFVVPALAPEQVVAKKYSSRVSQSTMDTVGMIPYSDPFGISSAVKAASSGVGQNNQKTRSDLAGMIGQGYFRRVTLLQGLAAQGFLYYDLTPYVAGLNPLPVGVSVQIQNNRFDFQFN